MTYIIIGIIVVAFIFLFSSTSNQSEKKPYIINQNNLYELINRQNINEQQRFISRDYSNALILDKQNNIHIFYNRYKNTDELFQYSYVKYPYNKIVGVESLINNKSVYKTNRSSQFAGAVVGSLTFGAIGMIIGGLSGSKYKENSIKSIDLKITVEDIENPIYKINFLNNFDIYTNKTIEKGYAENSSEVKASIKNIEKWQGIIDVLIRKQNQSI